MPKLTPKRMVLGAAAVVVMAILVPPLLNVNRYRADVASAIARALGRDVTVGGVSLRLLPQPGFALSNLVVADDPSFSAEPVLLAQDVTASLRLSSLWRGKLEIARLSLSYPSLNVMRRPDGHWNLESLLERTTHSETAPTATTPESRPRFPYIEAEGGRINLKLGQEKKAYALSGADFALWLASERQWRVRIAAQPMRTDDNLSDTGLLRISGSFGSASDLMDTPLALQLTLERAQLGQFTRLISGTDSGWRGAVDGTVVLRGTPAKLELAVSAAIDDFHRFDVYGGEPYRIGGKCVAVLSATSQELRDASCTSRLGGGAIQAKGGARWKASERSYDLRIDADSLQAGQLMTLARRMEKDLPAALQAGGTVSASLSLIRDEHDRPVWHGEGTTTDMVLRSQLLPEPVQIGKVKFGLVGPGTDKPQAPTGRGRRAENMVSVSAFPLSLGGAKAATSQAWLSTTGYRILLQGEVDSTQVLHLARTLALAAPAADVRGAARLDMELADTWEGRTGPSLAGSAWLRNISARVDGLASPLVIRSGQLVVSPEATTIRNASFAFPELSLEASGWVRKPRECKLMTRVQVSDEQDATPGCVLEFRLAADHASAGELERLLTVPRRNRPWYRLRSEKAVPSPAMYIRAAGSLTVETLKVNTVAARHVRADVDWNRGVLAVRNLRAYLWEGHHAGDLTADFRRATPSYEWTGELQQVSLEGLLDSGEQEGAEATTWAEGKATLAGSIKASGANAAQLRATASGMVRVNWRRGVLHGLSLDGEGEPLHFRTLSGSMNLAAGDLNISEGRLETRQGTFEVSGVASLTRDLKIRLTRIPEQDLEPGPNAHPVAMAEGYTITGRLQDATVQELSSSVTVGPLASSKQEIRDPELRNPEQPKQVLQKRETHSRETNGRGVALVPANRE